MCTPIKWDITYITLTSFYILGFVYTAKAIDGFEFLKKSMSRLFQIVELPNIAIQFANCNSQIYCVCDTG